MYREVHEKKIFLMKRMKSLHTSGLTRGHPRQDTHLASIRLRLTDHSHYSFNSETVKV